MSNRNTDILHLTSNTHASVRFLYICERRTKRRSTKTKYKNCISKYNSQNFVEFYIDKHSTLQSVSHNLFANIIFAVVCCIT